MAFAVAQPGVTAALIEPRTADHLDVTLTDEALDRSDAIVAAGTDVGRLDVAYDPPAIQQARLRRCPLDERSAG